MPLYIENVRRAIHSMLNDVVEQSFAHVLAYPVDDESAHRLIKKANKSLKRIVLQAKQDNLIQDENLKQAALRNCVKQAQRTSLELLSELQVLRRNQLTLKR
ncbi:MAG TPA: hypothetical protein EYN28_06375 [Flavobacteriales bacterium]|nr:hypothetical protein [Flavobacteriales bacterium]HIB76433.1 hypothetical protein [Flavobacteriales bacterium]HIO15236.1 hypothetical protein [Flavobacteriales bacterium]HIO59784.1 hypothetical protein [Flavobacteriales bacterium]